MIKINLAAKKQSVPGGGDPKAKSSGGSFGKIDLDKFKELPIRKVALPIIVGAFASYYLDSYKETTLSQMQAFLDKTKVENAKLQSRMSEFKSYDEMKKSLDEDEEVIRTKLDTIQKLLANRTSSTKILTSISNAIPKDVWLEEFRVLKTDILLKGSASEFNQISDFMKGLTESAFFYDVDLKGSQTRDTVGVAGFEIGAKRR